MKFGQLLEYIIRDFLVKIHAKKVVEKLYPDPFLKNQIENTFGSVV